MTFLPYHCPTFRTDHLQEPCQKNLARVKALKEGHKHVGPLEKCVECKGKMLITKPRLVIEGLPEPENWVEERFLSEPVPEFTISSPIDPLHPHLSEPAPVMEGKKPPKKEKTVATISETEAAHIKRTEMMVLESGNKRPDGGSFHDFVGAEVVEVRYCPTHPEAVQKIDKLGRWMGMCSECLSVRGKKCGTENFGRGITAPPIFIPLNLTKYAPLKAWLEAQAEEYEQTLHGAIMFVLKMAWRQGT